MMNIFKHIKNIIKIKLNISIRTKYEKGWINKLREKQPTEIVIHGTGGGSKKGIIKWMLNPGKWKEERYNKGIGLFHYLIGRDGSITEIINPNYWVYHSTSGSHDKKTIGIELVNPSKTNKRKYTEKQYIALIDLIKNNLMMKYRIDTIVSHKFNIWKYNKNARKYDKECPGNFNWNRLNKEIEKCEINF